MLLVLFITLGIRSYAREVKRVISLAPSLTENIYLLGAKEKLVGCTSYCTRAVSDGVEQIGSTIDVNIEKIFALQPDLVITMQLTKTQDLDALKKLGIRVEVIQTPKNFEEICAQTIHIGKLVGFEKNAQQVINDSKRIVEDIIEKSNHFSKKKKVFFQIGANPIFTVLSGTYMEDFILFTNGENIASGLKKGTMTRESILLANPDVIIIATMGGFGTEEQEIWYSFKGIEAVKNKKVFLIDSETACSPTPVNFTSALNDVFKFMSE